MEAIPQLKYLAKVDFAQVQACATKALGQLGEGVRGGGVSEGVGVRLWGEREICEKVGVMLVGEKGGSQLYGSVGMRVVMSLENHVHQLVSIPGVPLCHSLMLCFRSSVKWRTGSGVGLFISVNLANSPF